MSMFPQLAVGGWTPSPRKLSPDSTRMAPATPSVAEMSTGASVLGRMWRSNIRQVEQPDKRATDTKSRWRRLRVSARTRRATPIHEVRPMTIMMLVRLGSRKAMTERIRKNEGKQSMMSTPRMIPSSTRPPK